MARVLDSFEARQRRIGSKTRRGSAVGSSKRLTWGFPRETQGQREDRVAITQRGARNGVAATPCWWEGRRAGSSIPAELYSARAAGRPLRRFARRFFVWAPRRPGAQGQGAGAGGVPAAAPGLQLLFTYIHLAAPRRMLQRHLSTPMEHRGGYEQCSFGTPLDAARRQCRGEVSRPDGAAGRRALPGGEGDRRARECMMMMGGSPGVYAAKVGRSRRMRLR